MARILIALLFIAVTVFAIADWVVRSRTQSPGRLNRWIWLAVILLLPLVGPLTWIITSAVTRAEEKRSLPPESARPQVDLRPDDDPDGVSGVADRIARRKKRTKFNPNDFPWPDEDDPLTHRKQDRKPGP